MPVQPDRLRDTFIELARIPSPSRRERQAVEHVRALCEALGYACEVDSAGSVFGGDTGNLIVRAEGNRARPPLFFSAHLDTVESGDAPLAPVVRGDDIVTEGPTIVAADDKSGCAVLLEMLRCLKEDALAHAPLVVAFTVAEEIELLGAKAMDPGVYAGCARGIVLDHSAPDGVILGAPAKAALRITMHGVGGHGGFPEQRINAVHALATALARLPSDRLDQYSTANLGILRGGERINIVPDTAYAEYEIRSHRRELFDFHIRRATDIVESTAASFRKYLTGDGGGLGGGDTETEPVRQARADVQVEVCYEEYAHADDAAHVLLLADAMRSTGLSPSFATRQGGSDANIFNRNGLPTVVAGCGMHSAHSVRERASISEMAAAARVMLALAATG